MLSLSKRYHLFMRDKGNLIPVNNVSIAAFNELKQGEVIKIKGSSPRSMASHNLFFAAVEVCFENVRDKLDESMIIDDAERFRAYCTCKAGGKWRQQFPADDTDQMLEVANRHRKDKRVAQFFPVVFDNQKWIIYPASFSWANMSGEDFAEITGLIDEFWIREYGISIADCKKSAVEDAK